MFEHLKDKRNILVTGCQRSGTRLVAKAIAEDTGMEYVDETFFQPIVLDGTANENKFRWWNSRFGGCVFHAPQLSHICDDFEGLFVVWVKRNPDDVRKSMERINWKCEGIELKNYGLQSGDIIKVKNDEWEKQKTKLGEYLEVNYEDLKDHPLWVEEHNKFLWNQTK